MESLNKVKSAGRSRGLDEIYSELDDAQDTLDEIEDILSSIVERLNKWKDIVEA